MKSDREKRQRVKVRGGGGISLNRIDHILISLSHRIL